ncbi:MAG: hypothetical protein J6W63_07215 [Treponema sp.]|nr:hypothetical protein [Treponema sp.]
MTKVFLCDIFKNIKIQYALERRKSWLVPAKLKQEVLKMGDIEDGHNITHNFLSSFSLIARLSEHFWGESHESWSKGGYGKESFAKNHSLSCKSIFMLGVSA